MYIHNEIYAAIFDIWDRDNTACQLRVWTPEQQPAHKLFNHAGSVRTELIRVWRMS